MQNNCDIRLTPGKQANHAQKLSLEKFASFAGQALPIGSFEKNYSPK